MNLFASNHPRERPIINIAIDIPSDPNIEISRCWFRKTAPRIEKRQMMQPETENIPRDDETWRSSRVCSTDLNNRAALLEPH